jgi:hypothetical protein
MISKWNGSSFAGGTPATASGLFGATVPIAGFDTPPVSQMSVAGAGSWESSATGNTYYDWAPDINQPTFAFPLSYNATAPVAPTTPTAPPVAAPAPVRTPPVAATGTLPTIVKGAPKAGCVVPKVRGLALGRAKTRVKAAGCKVGKVRNVSSKKLAGRVVSSSPAQGEHLAGGAVVNLRVAKKAKKARSAAAASTTAVIVDRLNALNDR